jgi:hypothetical protein
MPENTNIVSTPHYLLLGDAGPIGPNVTHADSRETCATVYGFSSKTYYDSFCVAGNQTLRPYPLLPGHLAEQAKSDNPAIVLVVVNAKSPAEVELQAVTAAALLEALQNRIDHLPMKIKLRQNDEGTEYQFDSAHP